jgi:glycerophosphoryl diester phosphodiesterase
VARRTHRYPYLDFPGPLAFAHRGGALEPGAPENTMRAFERAVSAGFAYLETDVRATSDGVLVVYHDHDLQRLTGRPGTVESVPWRELRTAKVGGTDPIPTFEELLGTWPFLRVNVDAKHDRTVQPLARAVLRTAAVDRVCVASFSDQRLRRIRRALGPRVCMALGPAGTALVSARSRAPRRHAAAPPDERPLAGCLQVPTHFRGMRVVTPAFVATAHRLGLQVHVWTVDDPDEMTALLDTGVNGLMTDRPTVLKELLIAREAWVPAT